MKYLHVKNWQRFQHYNHRNPPWIKLHFEILTSSDWVMLDDASKLLAIACMLIASRNEGRVPNDPAYIKRVAYINKPVNLIPLIECGFLSETLADDSERKQLRTNAVPETELDTEKEKKEDIRAVAKATRPSPNVHFENFKKIFPKRQGSNPWQPALKAFTAALKAGATPEEIIGGAQRYAVAERDNIGTPYIAQAVTWLRQQRWKDYPANSQPPTTAPAGKPSSEELTAKYSRKLNAEVPADTAGNRVEQSSPVAQSGIRPRGFDAGLVRDAPRVPGVSSLGNVLRRVGLDAVAISSDRAGRGSDDAMPMARVDE